MLTRKQHELLMLIHDRLQAEGVPPSFDEMKDALGLKSKSGIHRLVTALEERGFLRRLHHRARALEILKLPDAQGGMRIKSQNSFRPQVIQGDFSPLMGRAVEPIKERGAVEHLPLYGKIAAGTPIEALRDNGNFVEVPRSLLGAGDYYALKVSGDSMVEAGILDEDTVIIRRDDTAENGAIVVALVDGQEATLKRLRRKGNTIALEPANAAHKIQLYGADRVKVQGRLVGLIRKY
jgi:repressor LexA